MSRSQRANGRYGPAAPLPRPAARAGLSRFKSLALPTQGFTQSGPSCPSYRPANKFHYTEVSLFLRNGAGSRHLVSAVGGVVRYVFGTGRWISSWSILSVNRCVGRVFCWPLASFRKKSCVDRSSCKPPSCGKRSEKLERSFRPSVQPRSVASSVAFSISTLAWFVVMLTRLTLLYLAAKSMRTESEASIVAFSRPVGFVRRAALASFGTPRWLRSARRVGFARRAALASFGTPRWLRSTRQPATGLQEPISVN
jgi:hypothetical protein